MSDHPSEASPEVEGRHGFYRWMFAAAVVLSLATLSSAWTGYEAAVWKSELTKLNRAATAARIESVAARDIANRQLTIDVLLFSEWFTATVGGDSRVADEVAAHFRPEFRPVFEEWAALEPVEGELLPPGTPFDLEYVSAAEADAERLAAEAQEAANAADEASRIADNYVLAAVLYASVLFLAGISSKLRSPNSQRLTVGLSILAFVIAVFWTFSLPILLG